MLHVHKKVSIIIFGCLVIMLIPSIAFANSLDASAQVLYTRLLMVGKWIIIIKGAMDTINQVAMGNFEGAKKNFLSYVVVYGILWALPWAMNEVENIFRGI